VYLALNATSGDIMAVKQVELPKTMSGLKKQQIEMIEALKFESSTLKDLDHPHIVQYLGWEEGLENLSMYVAFFYLPLVHFSSSPQIYGICIGRQYPKLSR
jgi:serine/threonine protein kinase